MQLRKKIQFLTRDSIQLRREVERSKLEAVIGNHYSVEYVVRIIVRGIFCSIRVVVGLTSNIIRRHIELVMMVITFRETMQLWTIRR